MVVNLIQQYLQVFTGKYTSKYRRHGKTHTEQAARPYYVSRYQAWKQASHVTFYGGSCAGLARK